MEEQKHRDFACSAGTCASSRGLRTASKEAKSVTLHTHLPGSECPQPTAAPTPSYRQRLLDLLLEIQDMSQENDCMPVAQGLSGMLQHARHADEGTAKMILDAIHLGEDFACMYVQNFVEFPRLPQQCRRRVHSCK
jgi:hypothetical protein